MQSSKTSNLATLTLIRRGFLLGQGRFVENPLRGSGEPQSIGEDIFSLSQEALKAAWVA